VFSTSAVWTIDAIIGDVPSGSGVRHAAVLSRGFINFGVTAVHWRE
jgi:hypothetical protein